MPESDDVQGRVLTAIARASIADALGCPREPVPDAAWLHEAGACFVTLTQNGALRGCIGTIDPHRSLGEDVRANARAAALRDPRFAPLAARELGCTRIEVSVLTPREELAFTSQADALRQLRPGTDGVVLEFGAHRATFLPQVWDQLPTPGEFMAHLKRKAGLPQEFWAPGVRLFRYQVRQASEPAPAGFAR